MRQYYLTHMVSSCKNILRSQAMCRLIINDEMAKNYQI